MEESSSNHDNNSAPSSSSSAISLYQVFAGVSSSSSAAAVLPCDGSNNNSAATTTSLSMSNDDKIMTTSHYFTTNESSNPNNDADNNNNDNDDDESNENLNNNGEDCTDRNHDNAVQQQTQQQQQQQQHDDDDDKEKDKHHSIHNNLQHLITKYRKRLGTLVLSMAALWIYSQLRTTTTTSKRRLRHYEKQQRGRQLYDYSSRAMDVIRYLLRMISIPVSSMIRRRLTLQQQQQQQQQPNLRISTTTTTKVPTSTSSSPSWKDAIPTPLSHLLAVAESGNISKVIVHGGSSMLTYLHHHDAVPSSSSSSQHPNNHYPSKQQQQQQQRWSKTTLPSSQNSTILNQIISTLLQKGCHDISSIPESTWSRFWNGPAIMALPFVYLGALYWIMRRLQREQLEDSDDTTTTNGGGTSTTTTTTTTFADVAGINSSLQELSEVVSFLRHPNVFHSIGASPPRGILLHGPPGVGKTLLARAIAGELTRRNSNEDDSSSSKSINNNNLGQNYNTIDAFVVCSGSDFVETYVGRGAARVRALFRKVREDALKNFQKRHRSRRRRREKRITTTRILYSDVGSSGKASSEQQQRHDDNRSSSVLSRAVSDVGERMVGAWEGLQALVGQQHPNILSRYDDDDDDVHDTPLAIIFIDEIDALAKQRDSGVGGGFSSSLGGNDEREQTLNQLLTEMDGFNSGGGPTTDNNNNVTVIVIAATNRPHVLDPAILRSGRFDRHVAVHLPDCQGREDILRLHAQRIRYDESSVNLEDIAKITPQFSGADCKCLINEAALLAVRSGSRMVLQEHLSQAAQKVKRSRR